MNIQEVIDRIKRYCKSTTEYDRPVSDEHDKVLYGENLTRRCTGIVTTAFTSIDTIKCAVRERANLIISHEGMFWNHGDETEWLKNNEIFEKKKKLLDEYGIVVWRNCEYMTSGIKMNQGYVDGIAYGFVKTMGWEEQLSLENVQTGCTGFYLKFDFSNQGFTVEDIAKQCKKTMGLNGISIVGDKQKKVRRLYLCRHQFLGYIDNQIIKDLYHDEVDCVICGELVDYTVSAFVRDSRMVGSPKAIINVGNFNICECGMRYTEKWMPLAIEDKGIEVKFVTSGDTVSSYIL